jgi:hypothetical protein
VVGAGVALGTGVLVAGMAVAGVHAAAAMSSPGRNRKPIRFSFILYILKLANNPGF